MPRVCGTGVVSPEIRGTTPPVGDHVELGFGLAVLDNINVNGVRVGQGPGLGGDTPKDC